MSGQQEMSKQLQGVEWWQQLIKAERKGKARLPSRFQDDRRDLHRPVVPVFSVA